MDEQISGLLLINKPEGMTSVDVLRRLKKVFNVKVKIGHAGTLDPFAQGLLIVCLGRATRLVPLLSDVAKGYKVRALFGQATDTLDKTGAIIFQQAVPPHLKELLPQAIQLLGNVYKQIPPIFSALKHEGVPLYSLARNQKMPQEHLELLVAAKARWVVLYNLVIEGVSGPLVSFSCEVSKGAYIRTLANDLAQKIGLPATTVSLERTFIGPFTLSKSVSLEALQSIEDIQKVLIPVEKARTLLA